MHLYQHFFDVTMLGPKADIVRMLNTAMRHAGSESVITESDDLATALHKVKEADTCLHFLLPDFLDEESIQECNLQTKQHLNRHEYRDDCYDWVRVCDLLQKGQEYAVILSTQVHEEVQVFSLDDWTNWGNVASRLYQSIVVITTELYRDGKLVDNNSFSFMPQHIAEKLSSPIPMQKFEASSENEDLPF